METRELKCPNCGAPLDTKDVSTPTVRCPYCSTEVVLPADLRAASSLVQVVTFPVANGEAPARPKSRSWLLALIVLVLLLLGGVVMLFTNGVTQQTSSQAFQVQIQQTSSSLYLLLTQTASVTDTPEPTLTPTPSFASPVLHFGSQGIGEGMFDDARYVAVDGDGAIYVADYQGGRIQRFAADGSYQSQWRVGDSKTFIFGLSANHSGDVFVAFDDGIARYEGKSGKLLKQWVNPQGGSFGDLYATADGRLAAMWYEGRYGIITSIEGHREVLIIYDLEGNPLREIPGLISSQTDSLALDVQLAVNGAGTIYALSDGVIYQFTPEGKYTDRLTSVGDQPGQFQSPRALAVDGQGRLYLVDVRQTHVLSPDGRLIDNIPMDENVDMLVVDAQSGLWGVSRDHVVKWMLREK